MTIGGFTDYSKRELIELYPAPEALTLSRHLLQERLNYSIAQIMLNQEQEINSGIEQQLMNDLERLCNSEPLQYILGYAWFSELKISVDKNVLIPRPETEELVQFIRDEKLPDRSAILDICTGSGCIALALKQSFPGFNISGCDVSFESLAVASKNGEFLNIDVKWAFADVLQSEWGSLADNSYDLIVSNPPYVLKSESENMHINVLNHEPHIALFVEDEDPLIFYKIIAGFAKKTLSHKGQLWFEINEKKADDVATILEELSFMDIRIYHDLSGKDRFVFAKNYFELSN